MVEDITEWKDAQQALQEQTKRLAASMQANQLLMDNSRDVICSLDAQGHFLSTSAACRRLWGYEEEELIGRCYLALVHPDDRLSSKEMEESTRCGEKVTGFVNRCLRKDGTIVDVLWSASWSEAEEILFCVASDVTERQRIERELREAKEIADRANRAKSEFLSRMSHELRTPLNAILGFGQLLQRQEPMPAQRPHLHYILSAGRHLLKLIDEVLDISRIETDRMQLSLEPVSVNLAFKEAIHLIKPLANEHSVHVFSPPEEETDVFVLADNQRLQQVLLNLLNNGVKYTPAGGAVMLECGSHDDTVRLVVHDTGIGIASDKLERVFTPFDRLGVEQSGIEGTGLGLALSKSLVHAMQGRIGVESRPGEGTSVWLEFSRANSPLSTLTQEREATPAPRLSETLQQRSILYIEDNLSNLTLVQELLKQVGSIQLLSAMQGRIGLDLARQHTPDLILLDLHLPDMSGAQVLTELQSSEVTSCIPTVIVSADATAGQLERLMEAGARDYITKPIDIARFYHVVEENATLMAERIAPNELVTI
jgi:PAS domain S-box-containing protein